MGGPAPPCHFVFVFRSRVYHTREYSVLNKGIPTMVLPCCVRFANLQQNWPSSEGWAGLPSVRTVRIVEQLDWYPAGRTLVAGTFPTASNLLPCMNV